MKKKKKNNLLGLATGVTYKKIQPVSDQAVSLCKETGANAIEISCHECKQIPLLWGLNMHKLMGFTHSSLHMPTDIQYGSSRHIRSVELLREFCRRNNNVIRCAVFHPDLVIDWGVLIEFSQFVTIAIENMDNRKECFQTEKEIQKILSKYPEIKLVFDINHWITNGNSIESAFDFLKKFKKNIVEIHISGHWESHEPIFKTLQTELIEVASKASTLIPIIIESALSHQDVKKEYELIKSLL
ncbi:hypothetical protein ACFL08_02635 [Patescibacteria group bacterium]